MIRLALGLLAVSHAAAQVPLERIDALLDQSYPAGQPGAAVVVTRAGVTLLAKGYGLANLEHRIPVTPQTVFRLASVTKVFTATAVLRLCERGQLDLAKPLGAYLADYPSPGREITLAQLLSHTSGLAEYLDRPDNMQWVRGEFTVTELVDSFKERERLFAPGAECRYGNSGYVLLGAILEKAAGKPFGELLQEELFTPLEMRASHYDTVLELVPARAACYEPLRTPDEKPDWSRFRNARYYTLSVLHASGGGLSSAVDLARFLDALFDGKVVGAELLKRSITPVRLKGGQLCERTLAGWKRERVAGRQALMKGGALPGVCTWVLRLPAERLSVVLLSNRSPGVPRAGPLVLKIGERLLSKK